MQRNQWNKRDEVKQETAEIKLNLSSLLLISILFQNFEARDFQKQKA